MISFIAVFLVFAFTFNYSENIFGLLTIPLKSELKLDFTKPYIHAKEKAPISLVFLAPGEAFWMHLKVSFIASFILSLPIIFHQLWRFISPGLLSREKKYVLPFVFFATALFTAGAAFCFLIILPFAMTFLLGYQTKNMVPMISVGNYIDFCLKFILAFGAVFELPLVMVFLTRFGIVTPRTFSKNRKYAVLAAFLVGAVLTPTPDAFNQTLMAVPIIILYEVGILLSLIMKKKTVKNSSEQSVPSTGQ